MIEKWTVAEIEEARNAGEAVGAIAEMCPAAQGHVCLFYTESDLKIGTKLYTHSAQAVSVPSDEAIRAFLHESEGLLIASEDELLPLIREAVVALASTLTAPAEDAK